MTAAVQIAGSGAAGTAAAPVSSAPTPSSNSVFLAGEHFAAAIL